MPLVLGAVHQDGQGDDGDDIEPRAWAAAAAVGLLVLGLVACWVIGVMGGAA